MRVLAITTDASLEVALSSLPGGWEILSARDPEGALQAACHADLALIALGSTERGLSAVEALHRLRVGLPCLVVGECDAPGDALAPVLVRPFAMGELVDAMRRAAEQPGVQFAPDPVSAPPPVPVEVPVEAEPPGSLAEEIAPEAASPPRDAAPKPIAAEQGPEDDVEPVFATSEEFASSEDRLGALLAGVPLVPPVPPVPPVGGDDASPPDGDQWALALLHEIGQSIEGGVEAPPRVVPAAAAPEHEATAARIVRHAAANPTSSWLSDGAERSGMQRLRRRRRGVAVASGGSRASMMRRVRAALEGASDLETLLTEIPALARPDAMARALVREAVELLGAETAVLYAADGPANDGPYRCFASHGLSPVEQGMPVPREQPLLSDVAGRLEAVLVAPVDLVRGLVGGIAGTNTEALMIAPLEIAGACHGLLLAGRSHFAEDDLERFWLLAEEAAPGFAAALLLDRLRHHALSIAL